MNEGLVVSNSGWHAGVRFACERAGQADCVHDVGQILTWGALRWRGCSRACHHSWQCDLLKNRRSDLRAFWKEMFKTFTCQEFTVWWRWSKSDFTYQWLLLLCCIVVVFSFCTTLEKIPELRGRAFFATSMVFPQIRCEEIPWVAGCLQILFVWKRNTHFRKTTRRQSAFFRSVVGQKIPEMRCAAHTAV